MPSPWNSSPSPSRSYWTSLLKERSAIPFLTLYRNGGGTGCVGTPVWGPGSGRLGFCDACDAKIGVVVCFILRLISCFVSVNCAGGSKFCRGQFACPDETPGTSHRQHDLALPRDHATRSRANSIWPAKVHVICSLCPFRYPVRSRISPTLPRSWSDCLAPYASSICFASKARLREIGHSVCSFAVSCAFAPLSIKRSSTLSFARSPGWMATLHPSAGTAGHTAEPGDSPGSCVVQVQHHTRVANAGRS